MVKTKDGGDGHGCTNTPTFIFITGSSAATDTTVNIGGIATPTSTRSVWNATLSNGLTKSET